MIVEGILGATRDNVYIRSTSEKTADTNWDNVTETAAFGKSERLRAEKRRASGRQ